MKVNQLKIILMFIILLVTTPFVTSFGVTSFYWDESPLVMYPGQTQDVFLLLQNMVGEEDVILKAELQEGKEIAQITDDSLEYSVPFGSKDVKVNIRITIPKDYHVDDGKYNVGIFFTQLSKSEGKMLEMNMGVKKYIPLLIKSEKETSKKELDVRIEEPQIVIGEQSQLQKVRMAVSKVSERDQIILAAILIVLFILFIFFRRKRKKFKKKNKRK